MNRGQALTKPFPTKPTIQAKNQDQSQEKNKNISRNYVDRL